MGAKKAALILLCCLVLGLIGSYGSLAQLPETKEEDWTANDSMRLLFEAITALRKLAVTPLMTRQIAETMLKTYLQTLDPFSDYLSPEEYTNFRLSQQHSYAGVGMELEKSHLGQIVCFPYPHGPAAKAGIDAGDVLETVDGRSTVGESVLSLGAKIRGQQGTDVNLTVLKKNGLRQQINLRRTPVHVNSVILERQHKPMPLIRILAFTSGTVRELKEVMSEVSPVQTIVIDLRGNPGGSLHAAIDSAALFLEQNRKIAGVRTHEGIKEYRSESPRTYLAPQLFLWQDEKTASAAEVFIAALSENQRAVSIGKKTFGKGTVQEIITLADGSALYLTTGEMQTPSGILYHERGLEPTYSLEGRSAKTEDYLMKVQTLIQQSTPPASPSSSPSRKGRGSTPPIHQSPAPDVQIAVSSLGATPEQKGISPIHLLCFDRDFADQAETETWSLEVRPSLREKFDYYVLQRKKSDGIKFMLCVGTFKTKQEAEQRQGALSQTVNTAVFTEVITGSAGQEYPPAKQPE